MNELGQKNQNHESVLITTAISYTNGSPHIGHLYEAILADFIKRVYQIMNRNVKLLTGTDEHGKKIQTTAQNRGLSPIDICDKYANEFKKMNDAIGASYDYFIRTTNNTHKELVMNSIKTILNSNTNNIYLGEYSGYYNVREECFIPELQALISDYKDPITLTPYDFVKEQTYYFKLDTFKPEIKNTIKTIEPSYFQDEINTRVSKGLEDLSITRTSFSWGIPFTPDSNHVIYVWFDALLNYVTGKNILFPSDTQVKSIHLIGKDIIWFHSVIYPAILQACGYTNSFPSKILVHGFILDKEGRKMSKSLNNVISNEELLQTYPIEAIRYYFITNTSLGQDFKFDPDNLVNNYNNVLIKGFGNLFQRLIKITRPLSNEINAWLETHSQLLANKQNECVLVVNQFLTWDNEYTLYVDTLNNIIDKLNKELTDKKPWTLPVETKIDVMGNLLIDYYLAMCLMYPIIPEKTLVLATHFGWENKLTLYATDICINMNAEQTKPIAFVIHK